jgi:hypothetical protein
MTLEVVDELVRGEFMKAGDGTSDGFIEWAMAPAEAIGRSPELGELCWLSNTIKGDERARLAP